MKSFLVFVLFFGFSLPLFAQQSNLEEMTVETTPLEDVASPIESEETLRTTGIEAAGEIKPTSAEGVATIRETAEENESQIKSKSIEDAGTIEPISIEKEDMR